MTIIYDIVFILFSIIYLPYLVITGRYHKDIWQRFGVYPKRLLDGIEQKKVIWLHAVSVGEVMAARVLCNDLLKRYPKKTLVISTITKTGNTIANKLFKNEATIIYLPVDISCVVNRVLERIAPELFIMVETELWPNLITALHKKSIPIVLVNGRISPKSYDRYKKVHFIIKGILNKISLFCMQNKTYAKRIEDIGAKEKQVKITGNMKFDAAEYNTALDTETIRRDLGLKDELLLIAGSTHRGEEETVLKVYKRLLEDYPDLRLLIAPRHIERTKEIERLIYKFGFKPIPTSKIALQGVDEKPPVLLLDTMGLLGQLFSIATVVFMGGSLVPKGGQNILEPAVFSRPILFGPHTFNFKDIVETFLEGDAALMVKDVDGLFETLKVLLKDAKMREDLGARAESLVKENRGASRRNMDEIKGML